MHITDTTPILTVWSGARLPVVDPKFRARCVSLCRVVSKPVPGCSKVLSLAIWITPRDEWKKLKKVGLAGGRRIEALWRSLYQDLTQLVEKQSLRLIKFVRSVTQPFFFSLSLPLWIYTLLSIIGLELSEFSEYGELVHHRPIILAELGNEWRVPPQRPRQ